MSLLVVLLLNTQIPSRVSAKAGTFDGMDKSNRKDARSNEDTNYSKDASNN
jgi:hypothetical protein